MSADAERAVVRRARVRISVVAAVTITMLVAFVGGIAYAVLVHAQNEQVHRELQYSARTGSLTAPPGCTWLYAPGRPPPPGSPRGFPLRADLDRVRTSGGVVERKIERNGTAYLVRTQPRAGGVVQGVFDMRYQLTDRHHLLVALEIAELVGLVAAAGTGWVLGRRAVGPLADALARQRRFVTDASHELRTPVTQAYTRVQLLARRAADDGLPAAHREGLERLTGSVGRLGEIIDDLLLSARIAGGRSGPAATPVDLAAVAEQAVADRADLVREHGLTVSVDRPPEQLLVHGVESALRRAVCELLTNAVRHTPIGGRIRLGLARVGHDIELAVSDTGKGFRPAEAERIFDRFHRSTAGDDGHYGLGLALLREVVSSHGGTVTATSGPGRGARFTIRIAAASA